MHAVAIQMQLLLIDRDEDLQRPLRDVAERILADFLADVFHHPVFGPVPKSVVKSVVSGGCRGRAQCQIKRRAESERANTALRSLNAQFRPQACGNL